MTAALMLDSALFKWSAMKYLNGCILAFFKVSSLENCRRGKFCNWKFVMRFIVFCKSPLFKTTKHTERNSIKFPRHALTPALWFHVKQINFGISVKIELKRAAAPRRQHLLGCRKEERRTELHWLTRCAQSARDATPSGISSICIHSVATVTQSSSRAIQGGWEDGKTGAIAGESVIIVSQSTFFQNLEKLGFFCFFAVCHLCKNLFIFFI